MRIEFLSNTGYWILFLVPSELLELLLLSGTI
jgi:hypothetical protein